MQLFEVLETCEFEAKELKKPLTLKKKDYTKLTLLQNILLYLHIYLRFCSKENISCELSFGTTMVAIATLNDSFRLLW